MNALRTPSGLVPWLASILALAMLQSQPAAAQSRTAAQAAATAESAVRQITWLELVPTDWKPQERIDRKRAESLKDDDELAKELMRELRLILDSAPTVDRFDGVTVSLPGFVVPLEQTAEGLKEFLLVPYHGACIHTPPPPANQIVHVRSATPVKGFQTMSAVTVAGVLSSERNDSGLGVSGYSMALSSMRPYRRMP